jgi:hypothetical protein
MIRVPPRIVRGLSRVSYGRNASWSAVTRLSSLGTEYRVRGIIGQLSLVGVCMPCCHGRHLSTSSSLQSMPTPVSSVWTDTQSNHTTKTHTKDHRLSEQMIRDWITTLEQQPTVQVLSSSMLPDGKTLAAVIADLFIASPHSSIDRVEKVQLALRLVRQLVNHRLYAHVSPACLHSILRQSAGQSDVIEEIVHLLIRVRGTHLRQTDFDYAVGALCGEMYVRPDTSIDTHTDANTRSTHANTEAIKWPDCYPQLPPLPTHSEACMRTLTHVIDLMHTYSYARYGLSIAVARHNQQWDHALNLAQEAIHVEQDLLFAHTHPTLLSLQRRQDVHKLLQSYLYAHIHKPSAWLNVMRALRTNNKHTPHRHGNETNIQMIALNMLSAGVRPTRLHHYFLLRLVSDRELHRLSAKMTAHNSRAHTRLDRAHIDRTLRRHLQQLSAHHTHNLLRNVVQLQSAMYVCRDSGLHTLADELLRTHIDAAIANTTSLARAYLRAHTMDTRADDGTDTVMNSLWFMTTADADSRIIESHAEEELRKVWEWKRHTDTQRTDTQRTDTQRTDTPAKVISKGVYRLQDLLCPELKMVWISLLADYYSILNDQQQPQQPQQAHTEPHTDPHTDTHATPASTTQTHRDKQLQFLHQYFGPEDLAVIKFHSELAQHCRQARTHTSNSHPSTATPTATPTSTNTHADTLSRLQTVIDTVINNPPPNCAHTPYIHTLNLALHWAHLMSAHTHVTRLYSAAVSNSLKKMCAHTRVNYSSHWTHVHSHLSSLGRSGLEQVIERYTGLANRIISAHTPLTNAQIAITPADTHTEANPPSPADLHASKQANKQASTRIPATLAGKYPKEMTRYYATTKFEANVSFVGVVDLIMREAMYVLTDRYLYGYGQRAHNQTNGHAQIANSQRSAQTSMQTTAHTNTNSRTMIPRPLRRVDTHLFRKLETFLDAASLCTHANTNSASSHTYNALTLNSDILRQLTELLCTHIAAHSDHAHVPLAMKFLSACTHSPAAQLNNRHMTRSMRLLWGELCTAYEQSQNNTHSGSNSGNVPFREYLLELYYLSTPQTCTPTSTQLLQTQTPRPPPTQANTYSQEQPHTQESPYNYNIPISPTLTAILTPHTLRTLMRLLNESRQFAHTAALFEHMCVFREATLCGAMVNIEELFWHEYLYAVSKHHSSTNSASTHNNVLRSVKDACQHHEFISSPANVCALLGLLTKYKHFDACMFLINEQIAYQRANGFLRTKAEMQLCTHTRLLVATVKRVSAGMIKEYERNTNKPFVRTNNRILNNINSKNSNNEDNKDGAELVARFPNPILLPNFDWRGNPTTPPPWELVFPLETAWRELQALDADLQLALQKEEILSG